MKFVLDKMVGGDDVRGNFVEQGFGTLRPSLVKGYAVDVLQDVDTGRRPADLEDGVRIIAEIGRSEAGEGRAEGSKSSKDGFAVLTSDRMKRSRSLVARGSA